MSGDLTLTDDEIQKLRRMMALFDKQCAYEKEQVQMEKEMMYFPMDDGSDC